MDSLTSMFSKLVPAPVAQSVVETFDQTRCVPPDGIGKPIRRNQMYFELRMNQMNLANNVKWFSVYDPLVVITVGFDYGDKRIEIPSILGPGTIQKYMKSGAPLFGTVLTDVKITGPHPYRGSSVTVSVSFYRVERINYTKSLLKVIERLSGMIGMDQLGVLTKTGGAILDGLEGLMGADETVCIAAHQFNLPPSSSVPLQSQFISLITPAASTSVGSLVVKGGRLVELGEFGERGYNGSDFVLLSIAGLDRRENENFFTSYQLKNQAISAVSEGEQSRKRAKALLLSALQQLRTSDDFTKTEADCLFEEWLQEFDKEVIRYGRWNALSKTDTESSLPAAVASNLNQAVDRLAL